MKQFKHSEKYTISMTHRFKAIRFILLLVTIFTITYSQAQITAYINGKEVKAGTSISKTDLPSLEVSFKKPKLPSFIYGRCYLAVYLNDSKGEYVGNWTLQKDGSAAVEDFLKNTPATKKFKVFENGELRSDGNDLNWALTSSPGREARKNLQLKIILTYRERTGYQEYAQSISLLEPLILNVPIWDTKKLYLPFLDLTLDKSNIASDFTLVQNGRLGAKGTELGYEFVDNKKYKYSIYALSSEDYPGLNAKELADDFIHAAALYAAQDYVTKFSNYDIEKYTLPWDDINHLLSERRRIPSLSWKNDKEIKKMDLMPLFQTVEVNGLKGYSYKADLESRIDRNSKWQPNGKFVIYILNHPNNPALTLVASTSLYNDATNVEEMDAFLKQVINSIKL